MLHRVHERVRTSYARVLSPRATSWSASKRRSRCCAAFCTCSCPAARTRAMCRRRSGPRQRQLRLHIDHSRQERAAGAPSLKFLSCGRFLSPVRDCTESRTTRHLRCWQLRLTWSLAAVYTSALESARTSRCAAVSYTCDAQPRKSYQQPVQRAEGDSKGSEPVGSRRHDGTAPKPETKQGTTQKKICRPGRQRKLGHAPPPSQRRASTRTQSAAPQTTSRCEPTTTSSYIVLVGLHYHAFQKELPPLPPHPSPD